MQKENKTMTHIEALKLAATAISNALNSDMAQREEDEGEVSATLNELRQALTAIDTALKSGEQPTSEPVKVDEPTEEMCDAARWFILARDSNIHTWGGLSRCIDTTIPYIAEKMRNDPQGHITKWDFADCVYRLMQSVATPNQVKVSVSLEKCAFAASNLRAHKGMPDAYDYEITKAILEAAKAQGARFDYVE